MDGTRSRSLAHEEVLRALQAEAQAEVLRAILRVSALFDAHPKAATNRRPLRLVKGAAWYVAVGRGPGGGPGRGPGMFGGAPFGGTSFAGTFIAALQQPAASLLLQAVIELGERTQEGDIIIAVFPAWDEIIRQIQKDPNAAFQVDPRKWEEIIAGNYERSGLFDEVTLTPRSGDFGRDIIAIKRGYWSVRIIESVKHYKPDHLVRADEVRALSRVLHVDQKATKGIVSTTSDFAPRIEQDPYIAPLLPTRLELINGEQLRIRLTDALKQR